MKTCASFFAVSFVSACAGLVHPAAAQSATERLVAPSDFLDEYCLGPCACPYRAFAGAAGGRFIMVETTPDPLFQHWDVLDVHIHAVVNGQDVILRGAGRYDLGGEVAVQQRLQLDLSFNGETPQHYDSGTVSAVGGAFPRIDITAQTPVVVCRRRTLHLHTVETCPTDFDNGSGVGLPDGGVTIDDLLFYLDIFSRGLVEADVDDGSATGTPDGGVTIDDILYFLRRFAAGC